MSSTSDFINVTKEISSSPNITSSRNLTQVPGTEETSNYLFYFKIAYLLIIGTIAFLFGLLPLCFKKCRKGSRYISYANAFSGGIFIGIGLFHLMPEASEKFTKYYSSPQGLGSYINGYPMSYFIAFLSYSFILYLAKVAFDSYDLTAHTHSKEDSDDKKIDNNLEEPLLGLGDEIYHDCTNELYDNNIDLLNKKNKLYTKQNNKNQNDNDLSPIMRNAQVISGSSSDEEYSGQDEEIIKNIVTPSGQFSSFLHARNLSKLIIIEKKEILF